MLPHCDPWTRSFIPLEGIIEEFAVLGYVGIAGVARDFKRENESWILDGGTRYLALCVGATDPRAVLQEVGDFAHALQSICIKAQRLEEVAQKS